MLERDFGVFMTRYSKTAAFMIEMLASIVLMAICGCICLMAFVRSNTAVMDSAAGIHASRLLQNEAERFKAADTPPEPGESEAYFDSEWNDIERWQSGGYVLEREYVMNDGVATLSLCVRSSKETIYELSVKKYFPNEEEPA